MQHYTDEKLVKELKAGNGLALAEIYNRYYIRLRIEANYTLKDMEAAADAVHDVFANIWSSRASLPENITLKNYLSRCIRNRCIDGVRKHNSLENYKHEQTTKKVDTPQTDPLEKKERASYLRKAIEQLPHAQREVIKLQLQGFSHKEIMEKTTKSIQTIKNLLNTGKKTLEEKLAFLNYT